MTVPLLNRDYSQRNCSVCGEQFKPDHPRRRLCRTCRRPLCGQCGKPISVKAKRLENLAVCDGLRDHLDTHHRDDLKPPPVHHNGKRKKEEPGYVAVSN